MNKKLYSLMLTLLALTGLVSSCSDKEDIVFDHERQQFETRADRILLEYIAPFGTTADEEVYIIGPFNGNALTPNEEGKYETPVLDEAYKLMKAENSNAKWGIYLDPAAFQNGKTLADGFRFYSATQGHEALLGDEAVYAVHNDNPAVGTFTNVWGQRWESYYWGADGPTVDHDGFVVYVVDETGWDIHLYQWGDVNNLGGDWPGAAPTGTQSINGVQYKYWDMGEENTGLNQHLIFNDGGNGLQLADFDYTIDRDLYLRVTANGVEEIAAGPKHDGFVVYIINKTTWDAITLYQWGDVNDLGGGWPGAEPTGTQTINGIEFTYWDMGEENIGLNQHLIFNNNNGGIQLADFDYTIDHDVYLEVTDSGVKEIDANGNGGGGGEEPQPEPQPAGGKYKVYVQNQTGWDGIALYAWGDGLPELFGSWPGSNAPQTVSVAGTDYLAFNYENEGEYHLIFNNNGGGVQYDGPVLQTVNDFYLIARADAAEDITRKLYINDQTGWDNVGMYAWGDGLPELFGGWPGKTVYGTETIDGVTYKVFTFPAGTSVYNPIINGSGGQFDLPAITIDKDYFFTVTATGVN